jgi:hypothetical protein
MEKRKMELIDYVRGNCDLGVMLPAIYTQPKGQPCNGCCVPNCQLKKKMASSTDIRKVPSDTCPKCSSLINKDKAIMQYKKTHKDIKENMGTCRACGTDVHL